MGDIADGIIDGTFDAETGEYLGEGPGYPRVQRGFRAVGQADLALKEEKKREKISFKRKAKAVPRCFLEQKNIIKKEEKLKVVREYFHPKFQENNLNFLLFEISKDFQSFRKWFLQNHK